MKLLIVRPQPGADATAARVNAAGHMAVCLPLFATQPVAWDLPNIDDFDGILLTSANALRHIADKLPMLTGLPLLPSGRIVRTMRGVWALMCTMGGPPGLRAF